MKIESLNFLPTSATKKIIIIERIAQGINHNTVEILDITKSEERKQQLQTSENDLLMIGVPVSKRVYVSGKRKIL